MKQSKDSLEEDGWDLESLEVSSDSSTIEISDEAVLKWEDDCGDVSDKEGVGGDEKKDVSGLGLFDDKNDIGLFSDVKDVSGEDISYSKDNADLDRFGNKKDVVNEKISDSKDNMDLDLFGNKEDVINKKKSDNNDCVNTEDISNEKISDNNDSVNTEDVFNKKILDNNDSVNTEDISNKKILDNNDCVNTEDISNEKISDDEGNLDLFTNKEDTGTKKSKDNKEINNNSLDQMQIIENESLETNQENIKNSFISRNNHIKTLDYDDINTGSILNSDFALNNNSEKDDTSFKNENKYITDLNLKENVSEFNLDDIQDKDGLKNDTNFNNLDKSTINKTKILYNDKKNYEDKEKKKNIDTDHILKEQEGKNKAFVENNEYEEKLNDINFFSDKRGENNNKANESMEKEENIYVKDFLNNNRSDKKTDNITNLDDDKNLKTEIDTISNEKTDSITNLNDDENVKTEIDTFCKEKTDSVKNLNKDENKTEFDIFSKEKTDSITNLNDDENIKTEIDTFSKEKTDIVKNFNKDEDVKTEIDTFSNEKTDSAKNLNKDENVKTEVDTIINEKTDIVKNFNKDKNPKTQFYIFNNEKTDSITNLNDDENKKELDLIDDEKEESELILLDTVENESYSTIFFSSSDELSLNSKASNDISIFSSKTHSHTSIPDKSIKDQNIEESSSDSKFLHKYSENKYDKYMHESDKLHKYSKIKEHSRNDEKYKYKCDSNPNEVNDKVCINSFENNFNDGVDPDFVNDRTSLNDKNTRTKNLDSFENNLNKGINPDIVNNNAYSNNKNTKTKNLDSFENNLNNGFDSDFVIDRTSLNDKNTKTKDLDSFENNLNEEFDSNFVNVNLDNNVIKTKNSDSFERGFLSVDEAEEYGVDTKNTSIDEYLIQEFSKNNKHIDLNTFTNKSINKEIMNDDETENIYDNFTVKKINETNSNLKNSLRNDTNMEEIKNNFDTGNKFDVANKNSNGKLKNAQKNRYIQKENKKKNDDINEIYNESNQNNDHRTDISSELNMNNDYKHEDLENKKKNDDIKEIYNGPNQYNDHRADISSELNINNDYKHKNLENKKKSDDINEIYNENIAGISDGLIKNKSFEHENLEEEINLENHDSENVNLEYTDSLFEKDFKELQNEASFKFDSNKNQDINLFECYKEEDMWSYKNKDSIEDIEYYNEKNSNILESSKNIINLTEPCKKEIFNNDYFIDGKNNVENINNELKTRENQIKLEKKDDNISNADLFNSNIEKSDNFLKLNESSIINDEIPEDLWDGDDFIIGSGNQSIENDEFNILLSSKSINKCDEKDQLHFNMNIDSKNIKQETITENGYLKNKKEDFYNDYRKIDDKNGEYEMYNNRVALKKHQIITQNENMESYSGVNDVQFDLNNSDTVENKYYPINSGQTIKETNYQAQDIQLNFNEYKDYDQDTANIYELFGNKNVEEKVNVYKNHDQDKTYKYELYEKKKVNEYKNYDQDKTNRYELFGNKNVEEKVNVYKNHDQDKTYKYELYEKKNVNEYKNYDQDKTNRYELFGNKNVDEKVNDFKNNEQNQGKNNELNINQTENLDYLQGNKFEYNSCKNNETNINQIENSDLLQGNKFEYNSCKNNSTNINQIENSDLLQGNKFEYNSCKNSETNINQIENSDLLQGNKPYVSVDINTKKESNLNNFRNLKLDIKGNPNINYGINNKNLEYNERVINNSGNLGSDETMDRNQRIENVSLEKSYKDNFRNLNTGSDGNLKKYYGINVENEAKIEQRSENSKITGRNSISNTIEELKKPIDNNFLIPKPRVRTPGDITKPVSPIIKFEKKNLPSKNFKKSVFTLTFKKIISIINITQKLYDNSTRNEKIVQKYIFKTYKSPEIEWIKKIINFDIKNYKSEKYSEILKLLEMKSNEIKKYIDQILSKNEIKLEEFSKCISSTNNTENSISYLNTKQKIEGKLDNDFNVNRENVALNNSESVDKGPLYNDLNINRENVASLNTKSMIKDSLNHDNNRETIATLNTQSMIKDSLNHTSDMNNINDMSKIEDLMSFLIKTFISSPELSIGYALKQQNWLLALLFSLTTTNSDDVLLMFLKTKTNKNMIPYILIRMKKYKSVIKYIKDEVDCDFDYKSFFIFIIDIYKKEKNLYDNNKTEIKQEQKHKKIENIIKERNNIKEYEKNTFIDFNNFIEDYLYEISKINITESLYCFVILNLIFKNDCGIKCISIFKKSPIILNILIRLEEKIGKENMVGEIDLLKYSFIHNTYKYIDEKLGMQIYKNIKKSINEETKKIIENEMKKETKREKKWLGGLAKYVDRGISKIIGVEIDETNDKIKKKITSKTENIEYKKTEITKIKDHQAVKNYNNNEITKINDYQAVNEKIRFNNDHVVKKYNNNEITKINDYQDVNEKVRFNNDHVVKKYNYNEITKINDYQDVNEKVRFNNEQAIENKKNIDSNTVRKQDYYSATERIINQPFYQNEKVKMDNLNTINNETNNYNKFYQNEKVKVDNINITKNETNNYNKFYQNEKVKVDNIKVKKNETNNYNKFYQNEEVEIDNIKVKKKDVGYDNKIHTNSKYMNEGFNIDPFEQEDFHVKKGYNKDITEQIKNNDKIITDNKIDRSDQEIYHDKKNDTNKAFDYKNIKDEEKLTENKNTVYQNKQYAQSFADFFTSETEVENNKTVDDSGFISSFLNINENKETNVKNEEKKETKETKKEEKGSFFNMFGIFSKKKGHKVQLETQANFIFDNETKQWINKDNSQKKGVVINKGILEKLKKEGPGIKLPTINSSIFKNENNPVNKKNNNEGLSGRYAGMKRIVSNENVTGIIPGIKKNRK